MFITVNYRKMFLENSSAAFNGEKNPEKPWHHAEGDTKWVVLELIDILKSVKDIWGGSEDSIDTLQLNYQKQMKVSNMSCLTFRCPHGFCLKYLLTVGPMKASDMSLKTNNTIQLNCIVNKYHSFCTGFIGFCLTTKKPTPLIRI